MSATGSLRLLQDHPHMRSLFEPDAFRLTKKFARVARTGKDFLNISNSVEFQNTVKLDN